jgi:hypothetical protein
MIRLGDFSPATEGATCASQGALAAALTAEGSGAVRAYPGNRTTDVPVLQTSEIVD